LEGEVIVDNLKVLHKPSPGTTNHMIVETFVPQERVGDPERRKSVYSSFLIADGCKEHVAALTMK
jgi:hypothetical protein